MRPVLYEALPPSYNMRTTRWSWLKPWAMQVRRKRPGTGSGESCARFAELGVIVQRIWVESSEFRTSREARCPAT